MPGTYTGARTGMNESPEAHSSVAAPGNGPQLPLSTNPRAPSPSPENLESPTVCCHLTCPRGTACRLFWHYLHGSTGFPGSLQSRLFQIHSLLSLQISLRRRSPKARPRSQSGKELDAEKKKPKIASSRSFHRAKVNTKECPCTLLCAWQVLQCSVVASRCC